MKAGVLFEQGEKMSPLKFPGVPERQARVEQTGVFCRVRRQSLTMAHTRFA